MMASNRFYSRENYIQRFCLFDTPHLPPDTRICPHHNQLHQQQSQQELRTPTSSGRCWQQQQQQLLKRHRSSSPSWTLSSSCSSSSSSRRRSSSSCYPSLQHFCSRRVGNFGAWMQQGCCSCSKRLWLS